jgi:hypothetical protein
VAANDSISIDLKYSRSVAFRSQGKARRIAANIAKLPELLSRHKTWGCDEARQLPANYCQAAARSFANTKTRASTEVWASMLALTLELPLI